MDRWATCKGVFFSAASWGPRRIWQWPSHVMCPSWWSMVSWASLDRSFVCRKWQNLESCQEMMRCRYDEKKKHESTRKWWSWWIGELVCEIFQLVENLGLVLVLGVLMLAFLACNNGVGTLHSKSFKDNGKCECSPQCSSLRQSTEISALTFILFLLIPIAMLPLGSTRWSYDSILKTCFVCQTSLHDRIFIYIRHPETERKGPTAYSESGPCNWVPLCFCPTLPRSRSASVSSADGDVDTGSSSDWDFGRHKCNMLCSYILGRAGKDDTVIPLKAVDTGRGLLSRKLKRLNKPQAHWEHAS